MLGAYRFTRYRPAADDRALERLTISAAADPMSASPCTGPSSWPRPRTAPATSPTAPPNDLTPAALAEYAAQLAERHDGADGHRAGRGRDPRARNGRVRRRRPGLGRARSLITLEYDRRGVAADAPRLALVGKAVTFDSGGLSLKPPTR